MIVDCAVYENGKRRPDAGALDTALGTARERANTFVWLGLHDPTAEELDRVAAEFALHPLAVEDAVHAEQQRPKLEVFAGNVSVIVKTARYDDAEENVEIGQVTVFLGPSFVLCVRYGEGTALHDLRAELEQEPDRLRHGPAVVLHAVLDRIVDDYSGVIDGLRGDVDQVEDSVFGPERGNYASRIYRLKHEVQEFRRAVSPLARPLARLAEGQVPHVPEVLTHYFHDVYDHQGRAAEEIDAINAMLDGALDANLAQVGVQQNDDMRKISAWVAIGAVPTLVAGWFGMNFDDEPLLATSYGFWLVTGLTVLACVLLFVAFRRNRWL